MWQQIRPSFLVLIVIGFFVISCNSKPAEIPFPQEAYGIKQPQTVPLIFLNELKLNRDTINRKKIKTVGRPLDIDKLPMTPYDTSLYTPFFNFSTNLKIINQKKNEGSKATFFLPYFSLFTFHFSLFTFPAPYKNIAALMLYRIFKPLTFEATPPTLVNFK